MPAGRQRGVSMRSGVVGENGEEPEAAGCGFWDLPVGV